MFFRHDPPYYISAYGLARKAGFQGTLEEWLDSLTAFYLAKQAGYAGTKEEWVKKLVDPLPEITIGEVTTLEGGSMATVEITGTKEKPILNFGIPRGVGMADALTLVGGIMKGAINMNGNGIYNLPEPVNEKDAVRKMYVDMLGTELRKAAANANNEAKAAKTAAQNAASAASNAASAALRAQNTANNRALKNTFSAVLVPWGWVGDSAPYTMTVGVPGIALADNPHYAVELFGTLEEMIAQEEAFAMVSKLETEEDKVTFTCFREKPTVTLNIRMEVIR